MQVWILHDVLSLITTYTQLTFNNHMCKIISVPSKNRNSKLFSLPRYEDRFKFDGLQQTCSFKSRLWLLKCSNDAYNPEHKNSLKHSTKVYFPPAFHAVLFHAVHPVAQPSYADYHPHVAHFGYLHVVTPHKPYGCSG